MKLQVIDSSVLVARFIIKDKFHKQAVRVIRGLYKGQRLFHTSMLVPVEVVGAVGRQVGNKEAMKAQRILNVWKRKGYINLYELNQPRMESARNMAISHRLKGADAVIVQIAQELKLPMISYDTNINKAAKSL